MSLENEIKEHLREAMLSRDKKRLSALRGMKAELEVARKLKGLSELSDEKSIEVLRRVSKQRSEAAKLYADAERYDLVESELFEKEIIDGFLPQFADEATVRIWIKEAIDSGLSNFGAVMGHVMKAHKGELDGKMVKDLVKEFLP